MCREPNIMYRNKGDIGYVYYMLAKDTNIYMYLCVVAQPATAVRFLFAMRGQRRVHG